MMVFKTFVSESCNDLFSMVFLFIDTELSFQFLFLEINSELEHEWLCFLLNYWFVILNFNHISL
jgi:hypothetical protein